MSDKKTIITCGSCTLEIKDDKYRNSMHYGKIHNSCHDKMIADLSSDIN